jgi:hypothetical protein
LEGILKTLELLVVLYILICLIDNQVSILFPKLYVYVLFAFFQINDFFSILKAENSRWKKEYCQMKKSSENMGKIMVIM